MINGTGLDNNINIGELPFAVIKINKQGQLINVNQRFLTLSGYSFDEMMNSDVNELLSDDVFEYIDDAQSNEPINLVLFDKLGAQIVIDIKITQNLDHYYVYITPVANNNLADNAYAAKFIHSSEALSRLLKPYWEWNIEEESVFLSAMAMKLLNGTNHPYEAKVGFWSQNVAAEFIEDREHAIESVLSGKKTEYRFEYQLNTASGEKIWL